ncbi:centromere-associated protein E isoform X1 [Danio rerio]|uniref:Centromere-associated protein E n=1 Tax=Danio rerio TaxID=7955 RepID=A0A8M2BFG2_DANRE|nr:centromere-associated protein E isoform X1 [Danio rerio]|eukprot:XP_005168062.1 centromere-associated protein E isoform X1 [Danio rerio]
MTEESAVKVCVRVRPLIKREASESSEPVQLYWRSDKQAIHQLDEDGAQTKSYSFDRVFSAAESTAQLYQDIAKPLVVSAVEGYNGTIFAYGQTSSGKTFTMMGSEHNPGVIPLAMADVFKTIKSFPKKEFLLRVSYMEIYNETVTDLLCDSWKRKPLEIREGNYKNVYVADLTEELVTSPEQALSWITKGEKNRHYGKTKMNQRSSRSHTIFRMILESRERSDPTAGESADGAIIVSHLNLVDLAGAERASQTGAEGARFKEGCNINRSLFTLGQVIKKLSDESQKGFLNYRDSKLTRILQNSLGGNAKTVIICTITPATVDETVSTLQFASAAKRMKNDPHVTEVSDEGALLRRYRNEIVDLKRRLQEVSSVTQTTATERESLCQLLQEKDQLQREQEDRIKNLTKLLVTSSNIALIPKVPKRRVTWGGKLLRSAHLLNEDLCSTDMSFAEPYLKKRRADCSLADVGEDMDEFDSRFDFTAMEEPNMDMEMSSITVRSSSEGSHFLDSPRASELMQKVSSLESQLEAETQSKQIAEEMNAELQMKLSHLQNMLEAQSAPSHEEKNTISELEKQMEDLQRRLETEVQERQTAEEKSISLELKVAELEKPSEELLHSQNTCERVKKDLEEAIQLCETVSFEKDAVIAERDMIKHSLDMTTEELESLKAEKDSLQKEKDALQKDKDALQKDMEERRDADEFEKLEEESKRDYERELEAENSRLEKNLKQSEDMIQKLKADLALMSSELQKKTDLTTELQGFSGKDIVQEVTRLRRSLDDAETLSLETKKEWAFLRSENISLKERDVTLTTDYGKMEAEVKMLQDRLEQEKSRFKKMQTDLQKELMGAFDENTKLTALMDGKVPKNLTDNVVLEKTVCDLRKELDQIREREQSLQSKVSELETLPAKVDELLGQVCVVSEELRSVREERDAVCSAQASVNEAHQRLTEDYSTAQHQLLQMESDLLEAQLKETQLSQELSDNTQQLHNMQTENDTLLTSLQEAQQKCEQLSADLASVCAERDLLLSEKMEGESEELQSLRNTISSITEEKQQMQEILQSLREQRDQLKTDLEENVEMMIETQAELRDAQEKVKELQGEINRLESGRVEPDEQREDGQMDTLHQQIKQLTEELQATVVEKERLLSDRSELMEKMNTDVTSFTEQRSELQERLQQLERDSDTMKTHLEEKEQTILQLQSELQEKQQQQILDQDQQDFSEEKTDELQQIQTLKEELEAVLEQKNQLTLRLEESAQQVCVVSEELRSVREERDAVCSAQASVSEAHQRLTVDYSTAQHQLLQMESDLLEAQLKETQLSQELSDNTQQLHNMQTENDTLLTSLQETQQKCEQLSADLASVCAERDLLLSEKMEGESEELQSLRNTISSITEEKQQMQEILQSLREQRDQLKADLEDSNGMLMQAQLEHGGPQIDTPHDELLQQIQQLREELDATNEEKNQLKSDLQENVEMTIENQEELRAALDKVKDLQKSLEELQTKQQESKHKSQLELQMQQLREELESVRHERERLLSEHSPNTHTDAEQMKADITSLTEEQEQLQRTLQELRDQLMQTEQTVLQLRADLESVCAERERLLMDRSRDVEEMEKMSCRLTEERDALQQTVQQLSDQSEQLRRDLEENQDMVLQLRADLQSVCAERERLLTEKSSDMENLSCRLTEERDALQQTVQQLKDQSEQLRRDLEENQDMVLQLRADVESGCAERERLLTERDQDLASITKEREQLLDLLKANREEKNQLRTDLEENQENLLHLRQELESVSAEKDHLVSEMSREQKEHLEEMKTTEEKLSAVTVERDQLMESNTEHNQTIVQLRADLQSACAERDSLMVERDQSSSCSALSDGGDLQEILQGVRELIQVQGELKQKKHQHSDPLSPTHKQKAQLQQLQSLTTEMESLRNERMVLRKDLEDAAATSKMYQELLHVSKEELKQQQKENTELMEQSSARETQLQQQLNELNEDLTALKVLRDQHDTEIQRLQSELRSLSREKEDLLEKSRAEGELLRRDLQTLQDQLEKSPTEQLLQSLTEERDQLRRELQGKMEKLTHIETKAEQLEKQKILLESEVHSLSQSLSEVNCSVSPDQNNTQSKHLIMAGIETSEEKLQTAFTKLQQIMERPVDQLSDVNREEWAVLYQLVPFIPKERRTINATHTKKTTRLNHAIIKIAEAYQRLAHRFHTHFQTELQRDVCCFQESRLQDLLLCISPAPSQSLCSLQDDFQQLWEQRLSHLLEKRQQYLQKLECVLVVLEEGLSRYAEMLSEERQHRTEELQELKTLLRSAHADAVIELLERQISRRDKAAERLNTYYFVLLNKCDSEINPLKSSSSESERRLEDQRRQTLTLLKAQNGTLPKTEAELLQDNQHLSQQLQQAHRHVEEIQEQMKELQVQADASNQKQHEDLQELRVQLMEKQNLVQSLEDKLRHSEALVKSSMTPAASELAALKDKLVKMELEHIAVTTSHEKEISQMSSMLEHRGDVIRKLKETLRKQQQDDEQSFTDGDEFELKTSSRATTTLKEKKMEDLQKKNAQFESLVSKQQEEISKWKRRAYKMKESKRDAPCTPTKRDAPRTPTKRHPALAETEVNSPKRSVLDSPKSRFFDLRSSVPLSLSHHTQFFDNSSLGTVPDCSSNAAVMSNAAHKDDWWQIPDASPTKTDTNACPTQ